MAYLQQALRELVSQEVSDVMVRREALKRPSKVTRLDTEVYAYIGSASPVVLLEMFYQPAKLNCFRMIHAESDPIAGKSTLVGKAVE